MSYGDEPILTISQKLGCLIYLLIGIFTVFQGLIAVLVGRCSIEYDTSDCPFGEVGQFVLFPGSLIIFLLGGVLLVRHMTKDGN